MSCVTGKLTVFFESPFWVGVFERAENGKLSAAKVTFGAEPKDYDVYQLVLNHYYDLRFSLAVDDLIKQTKHNPKRVMRDVKKQLLNAGIGTKSQQALKLQYEQSKSEHKSESRKQKIAEAKMKFELKQQKKKEKHKGR